LKDDVTVVLDVNLLSGDFLAKQEQTTADYLATTPDALRPAALGFTVLPLLLAFATVIMILWYLESIDDASHFRFGLRCFVDFSTAMDNQTLTPFFAGIFAADNRDLSIFPHSEMRRQASRPESSSICALT
jgi:hypothetical protein